jgi:hypothetical protein
MASVAWGSKLVVHSGEVTIPMRSLRSVDISGRGWAIPVLADLGGLQAAGFPQQGGQRAVVDLTTDAGQMQVDVEIVATEGDLMLRPPRKQAIRAAALTDQRRQNVRGPLSLEFRGTVMSKAGARQGLRPSVSRRPRQQGYLAAMGPGEGAQAHLVGSTTSISAGGICVDLEESVPVAAGDSLYGEMTLPNGDLVPALMLVLEETTKGFRAEFTDISPIDAERLVRLVFHRERGELAQR